MMSYDERVVFHMYMGNGSKKEIKGMVDLALSDYKLAKGIAVDANDEAGTNQAQQRIDICQEKLNSQEK